jgi:hypothetical protein
LILALAATIFVVAVSYRFVSLKLTERVHVEQTQQLRRSNI